LKIKLTSVFVDDQIKAAKFYTEVLGFVKKNEIPPIRWLTVASPDEPNGTELLLEPSDNPAVESVLKAYRKAIYDGGIAAAAFAVTDIQKEFERMKKLGVRFVMEPTQMGPVTQAVFDDTCGNLIQIFQV
jgi:predicted enzyme related to lactoylglutathione lyase